MPDNLASALMPPQEAAAYLNLSVNSLNSYRSYGSGPAFIKLGGRVFYSKPDLDAWIASRRVTSTAEARALPKQNRLRKAHELQGAA